MNRRTRSRIIAIFLAGSLVLTIIGGILSATLGTDGRTSPSPDAPGPIPDPTVQGPVVGPEGAGQVSDLPTVGASELPREALQMIVLVDQGEPLPDERDGTPFADPRGALPPQPEGYYLQYTVPNPDVDGRGGRRLVVGQAGEIFYSPDRFGTLQEVVAE